LASGRPYPWRETWPAPRHRAVDHQEEEEGGFSLRTILKANRYSGLVSGGLVCCWASRGLRWPAMVWQGKFSLSFSKFFLFLFPGLNLAFEFTFGFCFALQVLKYFNLHKT
jgi:hypothetical protein